MSLIYVCTSVSDLDVFSLSDRGTASGAGGTAGGGGGSSGSGRRSSGRGNGTTEGAAQDETATDDVEDNAPLFYCPGKRGFYSPRQGRASFERLNAFRNVGR